MRVQEAVHGHGGLWVDGSQPGGAPGDVYIDPNDHEADGQAKLLTLFWTPVK